jgi:hypothetical protein
VFPSATDFFRFDSRPGHIRLLLMVQAAGQPAAAPEVKVAARPAPSPAPAPEPVSSPAPLPEPVQQASNTRPAGGDPAADMLAEIEMLRGSKALVVESDNSPTEAATYTVVDVRKDADVKPGVVAVEVKLSHIAN